MHDCLELLFFLDILVEQWAVGRLHWLLAIGAVQVVEHDTRSIPLLLNLILGTVNVEDMSTLQPHTRLLRDARAVAD